MEIKKTKDLGISVLFLAPAIILFIGFIIFPVGETFTLSFKSWKGIFGAPKELVGFTNYMRVLGSKSFWNSMLNILYFILGGFVVLMPLSFGLALLITSNLRGTRLMKTAFFMPVMLSTTAVALMWVYILNPQFGIFNDFLSLVGLGRFSKDWLATPTVNVWSVVLVNEWMFAGYNMLIFAAGLVSIPKTMYQAAEIDGCGGIRKIWYISIPLCKESFKIFSVLCVTGCLKAFDLIWAMTQGGPSHTSETPATLLYNEAFTFHNFGKSSAIGVILLILGVSLSIGVNGFFNHDWSKKSRCKYE
ncbi:MAG: carbohydrate ABC transporter permease [Clostridia bacterium]|jgi:raffinose/stachyose/melibiose transport system permease protein